VTWLKKRKFKSSDFKRIHPAGSLGQRLSLEVREMMLTGKKIPVVSKGEIMRVAIEEINRKNLGATLVVEGDQILAGIITDGDIRRHLLTQERIHDRLVEEVMTGNPQTVGPNTLASSALSIMEKHQITVLPIVNPVNKVRGVVHLHDILGKGAFKFDGVCE